MCSFQLIHPYFTLKFRGKRPFIKDCVAEQMLGQLFDLPPSNQSIFYASIANSMAVLALPGVGYDTYRLWETLALGSMPVLERGVGLDRTLYRLPALLVDDFADVTPDLVRQAYVEALYRADEVRLCRYVLFL